MEIEPPDSLYGLYQGTPLPERTWGFGNALPDRITLFQRPIEEDCEDEDEIRAVIGETLIHEVGHYFGLSEEEIEEIEEQYWRGETLADEDDDGAGGLRPAGTQAVRPALPRAGLGRQADCRARARADDTFLEIGPGRGALTRALAPRVARIVAVEIDRDLAAALPSQRARQRPRHHRRFPRRRPRRAAA